MITYFNNTFKNIIKYRVLYLFLLPAVVVCLIFYYTPMLGVIMAFQDYDVVKGFANSPFVGFNQFKEFLSDPYFFVSLKNTLAINGLAIIVGFPLPIIFALMIFSMKNGPFKKVTQTISYLPHFISWVVVAGLVYRILDETSGVVNIILSRLGFEQVSFMSEPKYFWALAIITGIWKELGWLCIIYLAALAGVETEQYESAYIDGAKGIQTLFYITLPNIAPTIALVSIFTIGTLVNTNGYFVIVPFDAIFNLKNAMVSDTANTLDFYIYQTGVLNIRYSYSTAIGLTQSVIAFFMVAAGNKLSKKINGYGAF